jgi:hypothetical protein
MTEMPIGGPRKRLRSVHFVYQVSVWGTFIFKPIVQANKVGFCRRCTKAWVSNDCSLNDIRHYYV